MEPIATNASAMNFSYLNFGKLTSVLLQQINELP
jgi:hypothetical protein